MFYVGKFVFCDVCFLLFWFVRLNSSFILRKTPLYYLVYFSSFIVLLLQELHLFSTSSARCHRSGWRLASPFNSVRSSSSHFLSWTALTSLTIWSPYSPEATSMTAARTDRGHVFVEGISPYVIVKFCGVWLSSF